MSQATTKIGLTTMFLLLRSKAKCHKQPQKSALLQCFWCCEAKQNVTSNHKNPPYYNVSAVAKQNKMLQATTKIGLTTMSLC
jgi:hypothetical protein